MWKTKKSCQLSVPPLFARSLFLIQERTVDLGVCRKAFRTTIPYYHLDKFYQSPCHTTSSNDLLLSKSCRPRWTWSPLSSKKKMKDEKNSKFPVFWLVTWKGKLLFLKIRFSELSLKWAADLVLNYFVRRKNVIKTRTMCRWEQNFPNKETTKKSLGVRLCLAHESYCKIERTKESCRADILYAH